MYSCGYFINTAKENNTFNYSCNLLVKINDQNLYGDCYVYKNNDGFFIDMYTFGSMVFRLQESGKKIKVYLQNYEQEYCLDDKFFSLDYEKFKNILLSFLQSEELANEYNEDYEILTFNEVDMRKLVFKDLKKENFIEFIIKK